MEALKSIHVTSVMAMVHLAQRAKIVQVKLADQLCMILVMCAMAMVPLAPKTSAVTVLSTVTEPVTVLLSLMTAMFAVETVLAVVSMTWTVKAHAVAVPKWIHAMCAVVTVRLARLLKIAMAKLEDQPCTILAMYVVATVPLALKISAATELSTVTELVTDQPLSTSVMFVAETVLPVA